MAKLVNEFSWSPSRERIYQRCARAYYLHYYASWGGWDRRAPESARLAYRLKQMTTLPMLAGTVVHEILAQSIQEIRAGRSAERGSMLRDASARLNRAWRESRQKAWLERSPKHVTNLLEHYYGEHEGGEPVSAEVIHKTKHTVETCIDRYLTSGVHTGLKASRGQDVRACEELRSFQVGGTKVWIAIDLARESEAGLLTIYDWKTGHQRPEDLFQLQVYALYACGAWELDAAAIQTVGVYLLAGEEKGERFDSVLRDQTVAEIEASSARLRARLREPEKNEAVEGGFEMISDRGQCAQCSFQEICRDQWE